MIKNKKGGVSVFHLFGLLRNILQSLRRSSCLSRQSFAASRLMAGVILNKSASISDLETLTGLRICLMTIGTSSGWSIAKWMSLNKLHALSGLTHIFPIIPPFWSRLYHLNIAKVKPEFELDSALIIQLFPTIFCMSACLYFLPNK